MSVTLLLTGLSIFFALAYLQNKIKLKKINSKFITQQSELKKLISNEEIIQKELKNLKEKLRNAIEDPVTHLLGWELFEDRLNQNLHESARYQLTMAIVFIDIKDFKIINEALGYDVGDEILIEAAKRLQDCIRQVDSVSRYTKDVFVVLLTKLHKPESAAIVVQRMLQSFSQPMQIKTHELSIAVCTGISIYPNDGQDAGSLLRNADYALQSAKQNGQSYQFYQEKIHENSRREFLISAGLKRDSIFDEFVIYYQPILNTKKKNIFCMQALLYWQHPELGLIQPEELFLYVERQNKTNIITQWFLEKTCKQFSRWHVIGFKPELLGISIFESQLQNSQFIYNISKTLQESECNPECLLLEITNTSLNISSEVLEKSFNMLKYLNVKLAVSDFGSSSFSINKLKNISANYLVLNNTLINDVEENEHTKEFIQAMLKLAHSLSLQLIIEGVESKQQMNILSELGCHLVQGNFISQPMLENEVIEKSLDWVNA